MKLDLVNITNEEAITMHIALLFRLFFFILFSIWVRFRVQFMATHRNWNWVSQLFHIIVAFVPSFNSLLLVSLCVRHNRSLLRHVDSWYLKYMNFREFRVLSVICTVEFFAQCNAYNECHTLYAYAIPLSYYTCVTCKRNWWVVSGEWRAMSIRDLIALFIFERCICAGVNSHTGKSECL